MKRNAIGIILAIVCLAIVLTGAALAANAAKNNENSEGKLSAVVTANKNVLSFPAYRVENALYLPLRASAEAFGIQVDWQSSPAAARIKTSDDAETITLLIGEDAILIGSNTYAPAFFFTDTLGLSIGMSRYRIEITGSIGDSKTNLYREFRFDEDAEGFEAIFSDYPLDSDGLKKYEMTSDYRSIPVTGAQSNGLYIASHNRSDDIFMGYVKEITGFTANSEYTFQISFKLATKVEGGLMGIGGAPGESVFVKAGVASVYPKVGTAADGVERIRNVDTGIQSQDGKDLVVVGNMNKPDGAAGGFAFKEISVECTAITDNEGRAFLIIGTDSGFEGFTEYYLDDITLLCEVK